MSATISMKTNLWECHTITGGRHYLLSLLCYSKPSTTTSINTHTHPTISLSLFHCMRTTPSLTVQHHTRRKFYSIHISFPIKIPSMTPLMCLPLHACGSSWMCVSQKQHMRNACQIFSPPIHRIFMAGMFACALFCTSKHSMGCSITTLLWTKSLIPFFRVSMRLIWIGQVQDIILSKKYHWTYHWTYI